MGINDTKLQRCIRDLTKIVEAQKSFNNLEVLKDARNDNLERFIDYAISNHIIDSLEDVFEVVRCIPSLNSTMSKCVQNSRLMKKQVIKDDYDNSGCYRCVVSNNSSPNPRCEQSYSGTYNSLSEVPGYGTEWNERCVPDGVTIRGCNSRCPC
jgi:hypothetical protein